MGICFVGKRPFASFLDDYIPPRPGPVRSILDGGTMDTHHGAWKWTVGQRARIGGESRKWYVCDTDVDADTVWIAPGADHPSLVRSALTVRRVHWVAGQQPAEMNGRKGAMRVAVKYRYRTDAVPATISHGAETLDTPDSSSYAIVFDTPQTGVARGQHLAIYVGNVCLGGGAIDSTVPIV
ncbi:hypothetical protein HKX48_003290 [Thoreauomyces humboldtii]|nr:hypothetical protein HKX48_003290 [Thoreauomyces humboldtii]